jgi:hypothetical protein
MDDSQICAASGFGDLFRDRQHLVDWDSLTREALREVFTLDELHHKRPDTTGFFKAVKVRNIRVIQRGEPFGFSLKSGEAIVIMDERCGQDFQRDITIQLRVARVADLSHAIRAEAGDDLIRSESRAGDKRQLRRVGL